MPTIDELRQLTPKDLDARVAELQRSLFDMRSKHNTGVLDSTADLTKARREIARCLTVKRELEQKAQAAQAGKKE
jgi:large subunit ribosomal protein L29